VKRISWAEGKNTRNSITVSVCSAPLDISDLVQEALFGKVKTVVLTSATLAVNKSFNYLKSRLGITDNTLELIAESPFDFKSNVLLFIPKEYTNEFKVAKDLVMASKGSVLFLFTSYRALREHYNNMDIPYPKFIQEYGVSKSAILEKFKKSGNGVLFATKSFWEGVDVKGDSLKMVIIHKLPFSNPSDLLYKTRIERMDEATGKRGSHWMGLTLPKMCIDLKQGLGRLIRSKSDYGAMIILDTRLNTARYQQYVLDSLPNTYITQKLENVAAFFKNRI